MRKKVKKFVSLLKHISPKYLGMSSVVGLFGIILIPASTVIIVLLISFVDRSKSFNNFQISTYTEHGLWLLFTVFLLFLNIANLLVITSLKTLLEQIFVFETIVFESEIILLDGYNACYALHLLVIIGLPCFILDRLFIMYCNNLRNKDDIILKSYIKCDPSTPSVQQCISYLVKNYKFDESESMSYRKMEQCINQLDGLQNEDAEIVNIISNVCWCCLKYNRFDENKEITHKEWEYFLTAYKLGMFPMTQPAQARTMENTTQLKQLTDELYNSNDFVEYYLFNKESSKEVTTLNLIACKKIIVYLRTDSTDDFERISDDDLAVKILKNLSENQLNRLLTRLEETIRRAMTITDAIHDFECIGCDGHEYSIIRKQSSSKPHLVQQSSSDDNDQKFDTEIELQNTVANDEETDETKLETEQEATDELPIGWRQIINKEGLIYYYNDDTNKTQWERPNIIENEISKSQSDHEEKKQQDDELPIGWRQIINDEELIYYHNDDTNKTQWERPKHTVKQQQEKPGTKEEKEEKYGDSPTDWRKLTTNDGVVYYHNDKLNKTEWEIPQKETDGKETDEIEHETKSTETENADTYRKNIATQTEKVENEIFETKAIYHQFFQIALKDISIDTMIKNQAKLETAAKRDDAILVSLIDTHWIKINQAMLTAFNDDIDENYMFVPNEVLTALNDERKKDEILCSLSENGVEKPQQWFNYLTESLIEYNQNNTDNKIIIIHPTEEHYEVWCIYIILSLLLTLFALFSLLFHGFISFTFVPSTEMTETVFSLVNSKEAVSTEWDVENFESVNEFAQIGNDQFNACDIGSIFMLIAKGLLDKFNGFGSFLAAMLDIFKFDIPFIHLLDEIIDEIGDAISNINFPMFDILTWPSVTIPFYGQWYFIMLFGPLFCFIICCVLFYIGWKKAKIEINKQQIGLYIMFSGFCCFEFVMSLGSMVSVMATFLPHSIVKIDYEYGYYYIILSNILVMFIGAMIFVDVITGEPIPLLSTILQKKKKSKLSFDDSAAD